MKSKIEKIFINEAIRIRRKFFSTMREIVAKEKLVDDYKIILEKIMNECEVHLNKKGKLDEKDEYLQMKLLEIEKAIKSVGDEMLPLKEDMEKLDKDQRMLYNAIRGRYPDLTDEDMKMQISPHIKDIR